MARNRCWRAFPALAAVLMMALAGCGGHPAAGAPAGSATGQPAPPTPVPVPAPPDPGGSAASIGGDYTLYKHPTACVGKVQCITEQMKVHIGCAGGACTIIRTNGNASIGLQPWAHTIRLTYNGQVWQAQGDEPNAQVCQRQPSPARVSFTLRVVSLQPVNGGWQAQQLMGTYTGIGAPNNCNNYTQVKGVFVVSTADLSRWPRTAGIAKVEQVTRMIWQVVDNGNTLCEVLRCTFVAPKVSKLISTVSKVATIGDLATATRQFATVGTDMAALNAAIKGHAPGTPFSAQAKTLATRTWNDTRDLQQTLEDLAPPLSLIWPVPAAR